MTALQSVKHLFNIRVISYLWSVVFSFAGSDFPSPSHDVIFKWSLDIGGTMLSDLESGLSALFSSPLLTLSPQTKDDATSFLPGGRGRWGWSQGSPLRLHWPRRGKSTASPLSYSRCPCWTGGPRDGTTCGPITAGWWWNAWFSTQSPLKPPPQEEG